jgi:hypothetical protein
MTTTAWSHASPAAGGCVEREWITCVVEPFGLGPVVLPVGEIVVCGALVARATAFLDTVEPGRYRLRVWVAVLQTDGAGWQRRIAAL